MIRTLQCYDLSDIQLLFHSYSFLLYFLLRGLVQKRFRKALPQRMGFFQRPILQKADLGSCGIGRRGILFHPSFKEDQKGISPFKNRINHNDLYWE